MNPRLRPWTSDEEARVCEGVAAGEDWASIAKATGRSVDAVKVRATRLGIRSSVDMDGVSDARERWGVGKPAGGEYWTRERTELALRRFIRTSSGMLPAGYDAYCAYKAGRPELPTFQPIRRHLLNGDRPTLGHLWLWLGASRSRVKTLGGAWSDEEHDYLISRAGGSHRLVDIARHLHRSYAACRRRLYDAGIEARNAQGYMSAQQVADEYGCDVQRVKRLIRVGVLPAQLVHGNRYQIDPADAMRAADALRAPSLKGKGWRYVDGAAIPPKRARRTAEPEVITRYATHLRQTRGAA